MKERTWGDWGHLATSFHPNSPASLLQCFLSPSHIRILKSSFSKLRKIQKDNQSTSQQQNLQQQDQSSSRVKPSPESWEFAEYPHPRASSSQTQIGCHGRPRSPVSAGWIWRRARGCSSGSSCFTMENETFCQWRIGKWMGKYGRIIYKWVIWVCSWCMLGWLLWVQLHNGADFTP